MLPFLYCVELSKQAQLGSILPKLYQDPKEKKMDTLQQLFVPYRHVKKAFDWDSTQSAWLMYVDGAHILMRQCGREYGFATGDLCGKYAQATQLYLLSTEELVQLPKNNIPADHHLVAFGRRAPVANFPNKKFKAKAIRNDMELYHSTPFSNPQKAKDFHVVVKLLNDRNCFGLTAWRNWKMAKAKNSAKYTQKLLQTCKSWGGRGGSVTSTEELQ